jgi:hypothetical protein
MSRKGPATVGGLARSNGGETFGREFAIKKMARMIVLGPDPS